MIDPNELFYPAIDLLCRLIAHTVASREETATADLIASYLQEHGFTPHRAANNVWAIAPDFVAGRPTLLLNSHHDTVKPVEGWNGEAFVPREEGRPHLRTGQQRCRGIARVAVADLFGAGPTSPNLQSHFPGIGRRGGVGQERRRSRPERVATHYLRRGGRAHRHAAGHGRERTHGTRLHRHGTVGTCRPQ